MCRMSHETSQLSPNRNAAGARRRDDDASPPLGVVGAERSSHNLLFTAEAIMTKTTQVVAPSNLDAGYQFEAQVDGKSFMGK